MPIDFHQLPHAGIRNLTPYKPGKPIVEVAREFGLGDIIKLASNENPLGCSPAALSALQTLSPALLASYPSAINHPLYEKLAKKHGITPQQLILSNGSDYIFLLLMMGFALHNGKHILTHDYAFSSYQIQAQGLGIPVTSSGLHPDWQVDIDQLIANCNADTALIFLANPNNPTGLLIPQTEVKRLLENIPETTLLVLDEAYHEYAQLEINSLSWLETHPNLVITRTFSKAYALAGLRLGYAIANVAIIEILHKLQLPFAVNQAALAAGLAALEDEDFLGKTLEVNHQGMQQLLLGLEQVGLSAFPSAANFITFSCNKDSTDTYQALLQQGIIVRPLHAYNMPEYIRVSAGTTEQNARFLKALATIRSF